MFISKRNANLGFHFINAKYISKIIHESMKLMYSTRVHHGIGLSVREVSGIFVYLRQNGWMCVELMGWHKI